MLSHLKAWILAGIGKRSPRRRSEMPRFRGQIESLESRSMLSATIGVMAIDFGPQTLTFVTVVESRPPAPQWLATAISESMGDAPWETLPPLGSRSYFGGPWHPPGNDGPIDLRSTGGAIAYGNVADGGGLGFSENLHPKDSGASNNTSPQYAKSDQPPDLDAVTGGPDKLVVASRGQPGPSLIWGHNTNTAIPEPDASYFSSLSNPMPSSETTTPTIRPSVKTYDTVFGNYSSNSLLLAADVELQHGHTLDDGLDDKLNTDDEKSTDVAPANESLVDEKVASSLDALRRERAAIDAVLADLHDVTLPAQQHDEEATSTERIQKSGTAEVSAKTYATADDQKTAPQASVVTEGGMVMLEPSGDANRSAYDLTTAYLRGLDNNTAVPLSVEASVGMYQAIDIGTSESRPATGDNLPLARPTGTNRPSVSAENAPAKKSEQPS